MAFVLCLIADSALGMSCLMLFDTVGFVGGLA